MAQQASNATCLVIKVYPELNLASAYGTGPSLRLSKLLKIARQHSIPLPQLSNRITFLVGSVLTALLTTILLSGRDGSEQRFFTGETFINHILILTCAMGFS